MTDDEQERHVITWYCSLRDCVFFLPVNEEWNQPQGRREGAGMRILVLVKQVPESQATRMDEKTGTLIREAGSSVINPLDLHAVECALGIKERAGGDAEIVCLSMGPGSACNVLREAMSMGADQGVLLSDRAFAGSDTWCTAKALALGALKLGDFDLILCGERATDGETGQTGPAMAAMLDLPAVTFASEIEAIEGGWRIRRMLEEGYETVEVDGPAVVCCLKEASVPRLPTLAGKRAARGREITTWSADDIGASREDVGLKASPTNVVKIFRPVHFKQCEKLAAHDAEGAEKAVDRLVELLVAKGYVEG